MTLAGWSTIVLFVVILLWTLLQTRLQRERS